jgi:hypothetical protein
VIVYSRFHRILFYNMQFLMMHTVSIEELHCYEWYRISSRPKWALDALLELAVSLYGGDISGTIEPDIARHVVEVKTSLGESRYWIKLKRASPLRKEGQIFGSIIVQEMGHALPTEH